MIDYYYYNGTNQQYIDIIENKLHLHPTMKSKMGIVQNILTTNKTKDFCKNELPTTYLTDTIAEGNSIVFYTQSRDDDEIMSTILGAITFNIKDPRQLEIYGACSPFPGKIKQKLIKYVIAFGKKIGMESIFINVMTTHEVEFYKNMKFTVIDESQLLAEEHEEEGVDMIYTYAGKSPSPKAKSHKSSSSSKSPSPKAATRKARSRSTSKTPSPIEAAVATGGPSPRPVLPPLVEVAAVTGKAIPSPRPHVSSSRSPIETVPIITIAVYGHATDIVNREFRDSTVRILSVAGNTGSNAISGPEAIENFTNAFHDYREKYAKAMVDSRKTKKQLDAEFPVKHTCKVMPPLNFDPETNQFTKQSTYDFMKENLTKGWFVDEYRSSAATLTRGERFKDTMSQFTRDSILRDLENAETHKIFTPVIDRVWSFGTEASRKALLKKRKEREKIRGRTTMPSTVEEAFGIFVIDTCNYSGKVAVGDDLVSKAGYNKPLLDILKEKGTIQADDGRSYVKKEGAALLSQLVEHLHGLGFAVINIIDNGCRACSIRDADIQRRIIDLENEAMRGINKRV